jgi:hypothetical protein
MSSDAFRKIWECADPSGLRRGGIRLPPRQMTDASQKRVRLSVGGKHG